MNEFDHLPMLIEVPVAAKILGISRASAYRWIEQGQLPSRRFGRRIYILRDRLREAVDVPE